MIPIPNFAVNEYNKADIAIYHTTAQSLRGNEATEQKDNISSR
tara:strand:- start:2201 stop:2329 length:129 start_codon:yes stop_codon:yes gene_type:complete